MAISPEECARMSHDEDICFDVLEKGIDSFLKKNFVDSCKKYRFSFKKSKYVGYSPKVKSLIIEIYTQAGWIVNFEPILMDGPDADDSVFIFMVAL